MRASLARVPAYSQGLVAVNDNLPKVDNAQLALLIGELKAQFVGLHEDMGEVRAALADASASRGLLHEKVDAADRRLETLESTVTVLGGVVDKQTQRIDKMEPAVERTADTVRTWALRLAAAATVLGGVGGLVWYGLTNWGVALWRYLDQFIPK